MFKDPQEAIPQRKYIQRWIWLFLLVSVLILAIFLWFSQKHQALTEHKKRKLDSTNWTIAELNGKPVTTLTDNNLQTRLASHANNGHFPGILIDLKGKKVLNRIHLIGSKTKLAYWPDNYTTRKQPPLGVIVASVGDTPEAMTKVADFLVPFDGGNPIDIEAELRFRPVVGRYVKLEMKPADAYASKKWWEENWPGVAVPVVTGWNIAELEIGGFPNVDQEDLEDAVVLPIGAAGSLVLAADDLSYYLSNLLGRPIPVISPDQSGQYPGTLFTIVDLKALAPDYDTMTANIQTGQLPVGINIERNGREILFKAWPYRNVLQSVWEFLRRQGVCWVSPDGHGDVVPAVKEIDLSFLPLRTVPSARRMYANWDTGGFLPWPLHVRQTLRQEYLNIWRSGWTGSWNTPRFMVSSEIPVKPAPGIALSSQYTEKFDGYPHNFNSVVPERILHEHPDWCGFSALKGTRICPPEADAPTFDMSNPALIQWVADKVIAVENSSPVETTPLLYLQRDIANLVRLYNLLPMDSARFDQSQRSLSLNAPLKKRRVSAGLYDFSQSGAYYNFINGVAKRVQKQRPDITIGALAYADVWNPPSNISSFSDNVQVEVCMYGASNLPTASKINEEVRQGFLDWRKKIKRMETYDYALLHTDYWQRDPQLPVAMVTGLVDRAKFLAGIDALDGGTQASPESYPFNPWNFYAYPRIRLDKDKTAEQILNEFFHGYFKESAGAMLKYYKIIEQYQIDNDIDMRFLGACVCYGIAPGAFPNTLLAEMEGYLRQAEKQAESWVVKNRVAKIKEGFDWIIAKRQLQGVALTETAGYPVVGRLPLTLDLSKGIHTDLGVGGNFTERIILNKAPCWVFWAHGTLYQPLNFTEAGRYSVKIRAGSVAAGGIWPIMEIYVGPRRIGRAEVISPKGEYKDYMFNVDIPAGFGVQDFLVSYRNAAEGGARNLFIKGVVFAPMSKKMQ